MITAKNISLRSFCAILFFTLVAPLGTLHAATAGFPSANIWFTREPVFAGATTTVGAVLYNSEGKQLAGTAVLAVDDVPRASNALTIASGETSVITLPFIPPYGTHRIQISIKDPSLDGTSISVSENFVSSPLSRFFDYDTDGDQIGDATDTDDDNDGIPDAQETAHGTDPKNKDTDGDSLPDGADQAPLVAASGAEQAVNKAKGYLENAGPQVAATAQAAQQALEKFRTATFAAVGGSPSAKIAGERPASGTVLSAFTKNPLVPGGALSQKTPRTFWQSILFFVFGNAIIFYTLLSLIVITILWYGFRLARR
jgi:hypothetical protein